MCNVSCRAAKQEVIVVVTSGAGCWYGHLPVFRFFVARRGRVRAGGGGGGGIEGEGVPSFMVPPPVPAYWS